MNRGLAKRAPLKIAGPAHINLWLHGLPKFIDWSKVPEMFISSDAHIRYWVASFRSGDHTWDALPETENPDMDKVSVTWHLRHDPVTGEYWADPIFGGYIIHSGPTDLQGMCEAMGIAQPRRYEPVATEPYNAL